MTEIINLIQKPGILISENGNLPLSKSEIQDLRYKPLTQEVLARIKSGLTCDFIAVASDLAKFSLAHGQVERLVSHLIENGAKTELELLEMGSKELYTIAKDVLGPLWAAYVHTVLTSGIGGETYLFAARDATPMAFVAEGILKVNSGQYCLEGSRIVHVDWNRWFMGQEDEMEGSTKPINLSDPNLKQFYTQMGFGNEKLVKIIEPGAWGSAANALKITMPEQPFELWFMFSHMPDRIYGFLNTWLPDIDPKYFEIINDTAEAVPKAYVRPTTLSNKEGTIVADLTGKTLESPYIRAWSMAVNKGAMEAGIEFGKGKRVDVRNHVVDIIMRSDRAKYGDWTAVLPINTLTWTEGKKWKEDWKWGKIPPLK